MFEYLFVPGARSQHTINFPDKHSSDAIDPNPTQLFQVRLSCRFCLCAALCVVLCSAEHRGVCLVAGWVGSLLLCWRMI